MTGKVIDELVGTHYYSGDYSQPRDFLEFTCVFSDDYQSMTVTEKNEPGDVVIYKKF